MSEREARGEGREAERAAAPSAPVGGGPPPRDTLPPPPPPAVIDSLPRVPPSGIEVQPGLVIPRGELTFRVSRAGGAGGQHVNKTSSRVELLWSPGRSQALGDGLRARVVERLASRLDGEGNVRIVSSETRSQHRNREAAEERLAELIRKALVVQKKRKKTKPSRAAKEARLADKKRKSEKKAERRWRGE